MKPYNDYSSYLKGRYGCKVYRIGLDAGFTCPNRDGTKGADGCIYCNADGSRSSYTDPAEPVEKQLAARIEYLKQAKGATKFIAYFQAFTNTYGPVDELKRLYDRILPFNEVVGLTIGTRPDAVERNKLELISSYADRRDVWIEYGLQSIHDKTLAAVKRGHSFGDFLNALSLTDDLDIKVAVHVILGLPGETKEDMMQTARKISELKVDGVKIHLLHILRGSPLEKLYDEGKVRLLEQDEYVEIVCDFLENLSPDIIIQRLTGQGKREDHIAPDWALDKIGTINKIEEILKRRGSFQGKAISSSRSLSSHS
jgi:uncharacterized protein